MAEQLINDPFVASYARKIDAVIQTRVKEDLRAEIDVIFDDVDLSLRELAATLAPSYMYLSPTRSRQSRMQARTIAELGSRRKVVDEFGRPQIRYQIVPEEFGPIPEGLEKGGVYRLRGFGATGIGSLCLLSEVRLFSRGDAWSFKYPGNLTYLEGESYRYDGRFTTSCGICETPETPYDSFTLLRANGEEALGKDFIPISFEALPGMVAVIEEVA